VESGDFIGEGKRGVILPERRKARFEISIKPGIRIDSSKSELLLNVNFTIGGGPRTLAKRNRTSHYRRGAGGGKKSGLMTKESGFDLNFSCIYLGNETLHRLALLKLK